MSNLSTADSRGDVIEYARLRFRAAPNWLQFVADVRNYCEQTLGPDEARRLFLDPAFREVHGLVVQLAMQRQGPRWHRMITVRLPRELHEALKEEATGVDTSLNRLCIAKLLRPIGDAPARVVVEADQD